MEQQDRDMLIIINERQQVQMKNQESHMAETKLFHKELLDKLKSHDDRISAIEDKRRPLLVKFFTTISALFIPK